MTLPPFSPDARCPKCGGEEIGATFVRRREVIGTGRRMSLSGLSRGSGEMTTWRDDSDWMSRTCARCGYAWAEAPLDRPQFSGNQFD